MPVTRATSASHLHRRGISLVNLPGLLLRPLPLPVIQPLLTRLIRFIIRRRPELFRRLGEHQRKRYLIDPLNLPFTLLLTPDSEYPVLTAMRRGQCSDHDARIAGTFLTLLNMVDGHLDGDALFFSRDLKVEGDTEAVVVLRNAMDDLDGSIADDVAASYGPPGVIALSILRSLGKTGERHE